MEGPYRVDPLPDGQDSGDDLRWTVRREGQRRGSSWTTKRDALMFRDWLNRAWLLGYEAGAASNS